MNTNSNIRKAAVLLRSLDSETAAMMLGQLSGDEASAIRRAIRELGTIDFEEQADVAAEFRRVQPTVLEKSSKGVELALTPTAEHAQSGIPTNIEPAATSSRRFEFLASASTNSLVPFLLREHPQTIAVVLAHVEPARAAAVLAALPEKLQAETIERLSALGETDPESVTVLERELATWLASRGEDRGSMARRRETVANILAATDATTRRGILRKLRTHNLVLAEQIAPKDGTYEAAGGKTKARPSTFESKQATDTTNSIRRRLTPATSGMIDVTAQMIRPTPLPRIEFDQLIDFDMPALTAVLRDVDANVLALALAGSQDELVDRICSQMPKRSARAFRRELRWLGPTRLSDVEGAQRVVAEAAARYIARRRRPTATAAN